MKLNLTKNIEAVREAAFQNIDEQTANIRQLFITTAPGQDQVYRIKLEEAKSLIANPTLSISIPHIKAEAIVTGKTELDVANKIVEKFNEWMHISALIEGTRMRHKDMVKAATYPAAVQAATMIDWDPIKALKS